MIGNLFIGCVFKESLSFSAQKNMEMCGFEKLLLNCEYNFILIGKIYI